MVTRSTRKSIVDYIDSQFESRLQEELKIKRNLLAYDDSRVHVCLYFISPNGHGLKVTPAYHWSILFTLSSHWSILYTHY